MTAPSKAESQREGYVVAGRWCRAGHSTGPGAERTLTYILAPSLAL